MRGLACAATHAGHCPAAAAWRCWSKCCSSMSALAVPRRRPRKWSVVDDAARRRSAPATHCRNRAVAASGRARSAGTSRHSRPRACACNLVRAFGAWRARRGSGTAHPSPRPRRPGRFRAQAVCGGPCDEHPVGVVHAKCPRAYGGGKYLPGHAAQPGTPWAPLPPEARVAGK